MARFQLYAPHVKGQRRTWAWLTLLLAWAFIFYGNGVADRIAMIFGQHASAANAVWQHNVLAQFGSLVILGFLWLWLRFWERRSLGDIGLGRPLWGRFWREFIIGCILIAVVVAAGIAMGVMTIDSPGAWYNHLTPGWSLASSLAVIGTIIQASTSEVLFRGWIMDAFASRWSGLLAVVVSIAMFTWMQGVDPSQSPNHDLRRQYRPDGMVPQPVRHGEWSAVGRVWRPRGLDPEHGTGFRYEYRRPAS